jgi:prophage DNA circulation protein
MDLPEYEFGHRVVDHEIFEGQGFTEDTGPVLDTFTLAAAVIGQDYLAKGKRLEAALRQTGPGVLVHPTKGSLMVQIGTVAATVAFQRIDYKIACKESGEPLPPGTIDAPSARKWTDALRSALLGPFVAVYSVVGKAPSVVSSAISDVNRAAETVLDVAKQLASPDIVGSALSQVEALGRTSDAFVRFPADLAGAWNELLAPLARAGGRQASMAALASIAPPVGSPESDIDSNRDALAAAFRGALAATVCDALVADLPLVRENALLALDEASRLVLTVANETSDPDVWRSIMDARDNTIRLASRLISRLPQTRIWTPPQAVSVFEASQRLFGDGSQVDDLLTRNGIVNPLWIADPIRALAVA